MNPKIKPWQVTLPRRFNTLNAELNPIRHLLALIGARHIVHVSRVRVKALTSFDISNIGVMLSNTAQEIYEHQCFYAHSYPFGVASKISSFILSVCV